MCKCWLDGLVDVDQVVLILKLNNFIFVGLQRYRKWI